MTEIGKNALKADEQKSIVKHIQDKIKLEEINLEKLNISIPFEKKTLQFMEDEYKLKQDIKQLVIDKCLKIKPDFEYEKEDKYKKYLIAQQKIVNERFIYNYGMEIYAKKEMIKNLEETLKEKQAIIKHHNEELLKYK